MSTPSDRICVMQLLTEQLLELQLEPIDFLYIHILYNNIFSLDATGGVQKLKDVDFFFF